ncbi:TIM barrel protein [Rhodoferax sp.]|uniref:sugar phosphate isomerase/epimerase family protein n=1 Tax=Rhodoferax sp. TaxID=50421 RepID=UPI0025CBDE0C|nr:TIM barrel protein [Rhodoferax sp.]MCM2296204.1 sugar phosphate isomerase/epimerase [Rhodoferax sp.]
MNNANMNDFSMDSRALAGSLTAKLRAVREAGFSQITLCAQDLVNHPDGVDAAVASVQASGLCVSGFQADCDFEGLSGPLHIFKLDLAKSMLMLCQAMDCPLLVLPASRLAPATDDTPTLVRNLRQLAMLAIPLNIKIAYHGWTGAAMAQTYLQAWDLVCEADMPNLGLSLDSENVLTANLSQDDLLADLEMLDADRLFLVQLTDLLVQSRLPAQPLRVLPGDGTYRVALAALVTSLHGLGYRGSYNLAAFNGDYAAMPPHHVAQRARGSALWLGQDVLQRSVPLPNQIRLRRSLTV